MRLVITLSLRELAVFVTPAAMIIVLLALLWAMERDRAVRAERKLDVLLKVARELQQQKEEGNV